MAALSNADKQRERRKREREWLDAHGYTSWENIHTRLVNGELDIVEVKKPESKKQPKRKTTK